MHKVSVVSCESYDSELVYNAVKKSLDLIDFKFKKNQNTLIKPNVLNPYKPEQYITTHPAVIDAICRILKENKCNILIGDSSGFYKAGGTKKALEVTGIADVAKKYNAKLMAFEAVKIIKIKDEKAKILKEFEIAKPVLDADLVINVPKLKTHTLTLFTGAVKNLYGTIPGGRKQRYHLLADSEEKFCELLLDIYQNIKPGLNIMDGIYGIEGDGPSRAGKPKKTGLIMASANAIALDIAAQKAIGFNPEEVKTTAFSLSRGLINNLDVELIGEFHNVPYEKPSEHKRKVPRFIVRLVNRQAIANPFVNKEKCTKCATCANVCPAKAISLRPYPDFDRKKCINCYCCHELCPEGAIYLKKSFVMKAIGKLISLIT